MPLDRNGRSDSPRTTREGTVGPDRSAVGPKRISRRSVCVIAGAALVAGCGKPVVPDVTQSQAKPRTDVPLRILLVGSESDAEAIRVAWSMTMEQPLEIEVQPLAIDATELSVESLASFPEQVKRFDVAIVAQSQLGAIAQADAAVTLSSDLLQRYDADYGKQCPAVADGLGLYGGEPYAIGVGAKLFALLTLDAELQCETWSEYHDWVKQLDGKAAEPLAKGWAAAAFFNRCASTFSLGWLFDRASMKAEVAGDDYVGVLEQMIATAKLSQNPALTPGQIWRSLKAGELRGGIGFELPIESAAGGEEFDVIVMDCPREAESDQLLFTRQTPLALISSGCRQTDASKQFIGWLSGGERVATVRQQTDRFSPTRQGNQSEGMTQPSAYSRWLEGRLQVRQIATGLMLPGADLYYDALDSQLIRCLNGELTASAALTEAADAWEKITDQIGRQQQTVAWKRTLGFNA